MAAPLEDMNRCLAILILKAAGCSNDTVASVLHIYKGTVGDVEYWFKNLPDSEAAALCDDEAIKNAYWLEIVPSGEAIEYMEYKKFVVAAQVNSGSLLAHYGKMKVATKPPPLTPGRHEHYTRLTEAAEKLRLNIKNIKESKGKLVGNVTDGYIQISKNEVKSLQRVDRLDAACLLTHLKATFFQQFDGIGDWENLISRDLVVLKLSDSLAKKLKEVSHGLALKGTCQICASWLETS